MRCKKTKYSAHPEYGRVAKRAYELSRTMTSWDAIYGVIRGEFPITWENMRDEPMPFKVYGTATGPTSPKYCYYVRIGHNHYREGNISPLFLLHKE